MCCALASSRNASAQGCSASSPRLRSRAEAPPEMCLVRLPSHSLRRRSTSCAQPNAGFIHRKSPCAGSLVSSVNAKLSTGSVFGPYGTRPRMRGPHSPMKRALLRINAMRAVGSGSDHARQSGCEAGRDRSRPRTDVRSSQQARASLARDRAEPREQPDTSSSVPRIREIRNRE